MTTSPGWYDDGNGAIRWWDGEHWTEHLAGSPGAPPTMTATAHPPAAPVAPGAGRSRAWIVWLVLGVVVIGLLIAGALLFLPALWAAQGTSGVAGASTATSAQQKKAEATITRYDEAWKKADCVAYLGSTTEDFRTRFGLGDCSAFETQAESLDAAVDDYHIVIDDIRKDGDRLIVSTTESFTALLDDTGARLTKPKKDSVQWEYVLVADGSVWMIDSMR